MRESDGSLPAFPAPPCSAVAKGPVGCDCDCEHCPVKPECSSFVLNGVRFTFTVNPGGPSGWGEVLL